MASYLLAKSELPVHELDHVIPDGGHQPSKGKRGHVGYVRDCLENDIVEAGGKRWYVTAILRGSPFGRASLDGAGESVGDFKGDIQEIPRNILVSKVIRLGA